MVAPELLVKLPSSIFHPVPLWVMVPALVIELSVAPLKVQVPATKIVPLLVRVPSIVVDGPVPKSTVHPEAMVLAMTSELPVFLLKLIVPPKVPEQVTVEVSLLDPSKVTVPLLL